MRDASWVLAVDAEGMPGGVGIGAGAAEATATRPAKAARREVGAFMVKLAVDLSLSFATSREAQQEALKGKRLLLGRLEHVETKWTGVQIYIYIYLYPSCLYTCVYVSKVRVRVCQSNILGLQLPSPSCRSGTLHCTHFLVVISLATPPRVKTLSESTC